MRIAMFLDSSFPPDSRVENEAVSLIEAGHEVHLFSLCKLNLPEKETVNSIQVHRYPLSSLAYKASALAYDVPLYHWLVSKFIINFVNEVKPDVLHVHDMLLAKPVINQFKDKVPIVLDLHENRPEIMRFYPHLKRFPANMLINLKRWARAQQQLMEAANYLILVTKEAKMQVLSQLDIVADKIILVPNSIKKDIFLHYPINKEIKNRFADTFNVVYVGDTGLRRGTDTAIEAVAILKEKVSKIRLILVGKSTEDVYLKELATKLKVNDLISFEGWQDVSLFPSYIATADVCISPLHRNPHHDTTYANKIFQYMALGKAQVVSDCPAQAQVIEEANCGLIHKANDAQDLADKILSLYTDEKLRIQLGANGKQAMDERLHWDESKKGLIELYNSIKPLGNE
jgi:glycosyltransferase involved in cell wall biosynthesis